MRGTLAKVGVASLTVLLALVVWSIGYGDESPDVTPPAPTSAATQAGEGSASSPDTASRRESPTPSAPQPTSSPAAASTSYPQDPEPNADRPNLWTVTGVVDGDTIDVRRDGTNERVRVIGIDTPERGDCGFNEATDNMTRLVDGEQVELPSAGAGTDDRDHYGRILRYVILNPEGDAVDAGYEQIQDGLAIARYDSRDGYGAHPREDDYVRADDATSPAYGCAASEEPAETEPEPEAEPEPEPDTAEPWNQPGPDLDCSDIGKKVRVEAPDHHRLDADGDGWGCESYG